ncbi:MAG: 3-methyladenine DNA glycosylase [Anaerolineae bacterium]|nr:3-methyladenine DNA glycosylase [Anaerolineae bacterium]
MTVITIAIPPGFCFWPTVMSHGWYNLPPFSCDHDLQTLFRIQQLQDGAVIKMGIAREVDNTLSVMTQVDLNPAQVEELTGVVERCMNFAVDLTAFYDLMRDHPRYEWIEQVGAGRMLSAPTVWEDLVKTLLTTNTSWDMTTQMVRRLVTLGEPHSTGLHAFPTPERLAAMTPDDLNAHVRAGYRNAYLHTLATRIAEGTLEVESWRDPAIPSAELYQRVTALKGFGPYAAGSVLKLLGHFDRLATDSECRETYEVLVNGGVPGTDKEIAAYYEPFGRWRGLVQWMDVMGGPLMESQDF